MQNNVLCDHIDELLEMVLVIYRFVRTLVHICIMYYLTPLLILLVMPNGCPTFAIISTYFFFYHCVSPMSSYICQFKQTIEDDFGLVSIEVI